MGEISVLHIYSVFFQNKKDISNMFLFHWCFNRIAGFCNGFCLKSNNKEIRYNGKNIYKRNEKSNKQNTKIKQMKMNKK